MTIAQQLNVKTFPFTIKDDNGKEIYCEISNGNWVKREYDNKGNQIYYEDNDGYWEKKEFDDNGNTIYWETPKGIVIDDRPKPTPEYTMEELVNKIGHNFKIKK